MIIKADKEAQKLLAELADVVLKSVGIQAYTKIGTLLNSIQEYKDVPQLNVVKENETETQN